MIFSFCSLRLCAVPLSSARCCVLTITGSSPHLLSSGHTSVCWVHYTPELALVLRSAHFLFFTLACCDALHLGVGPCAASAYFLFFALVCWDTVHRGAGPCAASAYFLFFALVCWDALHLRVGPCAAVCIFSFLCISVLGYSTPRSWPLCCGLLIWYMFPI